MIVLKRIQITSDYLEVLLDCLKDIRSSAGISFSERDRLNNIIKNTKKYLDKNK